MFAVRTPEMGSWMMYLRTCWTLTYRGMSIIAMNVFSNGTYYMESTLMCITRSRDDYTILYVAAAEWNEPEAHMGIRGR